MTRRRDDEYFREWRQALRLARGGAEHRGEDLRARDGRPQVDRRFAALFSDNANRVFRLA
jgi:hypothetical protein